MSEKKGGQFKGRFRLRRGRYNKTNESSKNNENENVGTDDKNASLSEEEKAKLAKRAERFNKPSHTSEYGFLSRGEDTRLRDSPEEREKFFESILRTFVTYCDSNTPSTLNYNLKLFINSNSNDFLNDHNQKLDTKESDDHSRQQMHSDATIEKVLMSLRKLREALISQPPDQFTIKVFLFSIRITSMIGHYQSYIPSISYLLRKEPSKLLSSEETAEIAILMILHVSHCNNDNTKALRYYYKYIHKPDDTKTLEILKSWITKDYYNWIRLYNSESDNSRAHIMGFGLRTILEHMIFCMTRSYFTFKVCDLEKILPNGITYDHLVEKYQAPWRRNENTIIIRERAR